jgi:hypothetical protein
MQSFGRDLKQDLSTLDGDPAYVALPSSMPKVLSMKATYDEAIR